MDEISAQHEQTYKIQEEGLLLVRLLVHSHSSLARSLAHCVIFGVRDLGFTEPLWCKLLLFFLLYYLLQAKSKKIDAG